MFKSGARMFRGKRSVRLLAANRAWWAVSGQRLKAQKPKKAAEDMELDRVSCSSSASGASVSGLSSAGAPRSKEAKEEKDEAGTLASGVPLEAPPGLGEPAAIKDKPRKKASVKKLAVSDTPFAYLVRGLRCELSVPPRSKENSPEEPVQPRPKETSHEELLQPMAQETNATLNQHACNNSFFHDCAWHDFLDLAW